jgi:serine/threonine protein kinase/Tfp pilus assembly protein PilF
MDKPPFKPPENDRSQDTLETRAGSVPPQISSPDHNHSAVSSPPTHQSTFAPGDTVAKRFKILRFIAQGGMGEVYEALDIELKQRVALKTVRSAFLADANALERFRQEIVVAKRVTHPNVCRTYDLFRHEATKDGESDLLVVSMEFLAGQNLDQLLKEKGKLSTAEALPLVKQMVAGLAAAHQAGVVHRDFKANNVMLVPPASGSGSVRVVVSDFGLAHSLDAGEFALTRTGEMLGTPAYMAPEQVTGKEITPATDIYSLGVVMFEMVTGRLPFEGKNWREVAFMRIESPPPTPKNLVPDLDEKWSRTILKCLEREPADRFTDVQDVERALAGETDTLLRAESATRQRRRRALLTALGLAAVALIGIVLGIAFPNLFQLRRSPSVTVLGFKNVNGDKNLDPWGDQFRNTLQSRLDIKPVTYKTLGSMANPWTPPAPSQMPDEPPPDLLTRVHQFGCRYVIYGTYAVEGNPGARTIVWDIHMFDVEKGQSGGSLHKRLLESDRETVAVSTGGELLNILGVSEVAGNPQVKSNLVSESFGTGMRKMENFDFEGARQDFQKALDADPANAEIRSALAEAFWNLGYEEKAREESAAALDQAKNLSSDQKIRIGLRQKEYAKQWDYAADTYRALWKTQPDNYFYGLELAKNQMEGNHLKESLATLEQLKAKDVPVGVQAQADLGLAGVQTRLGDNQQRLKAAEQAVQEAQAIGSQFLLVNAGIERCLALQYLGRVNEADSVCSETVQESQKLGIASVIAHAKTAQANLFLSRGQYPEADRLYEEARAATHAMGDLHNEAGALLNLGVVQYRENHLPEARKLWESSLRVSRERGGVNGDLMQAQEAIANVDGAMGNPKSQISVLQEVAKEAELVGDKERVANTLGNICSTQISSGDLPAAKPNCERALQFRRDMQDQSALARSLTDMGDYFSASDMLPEAEDKYRAALAIQTNIGEKATVRTTRRGIAQIEMERGNFPQAESELKALLPEFAQASDADDEAETRGILADLYLRLGQLKDAQEEITKGLDLAAKSSDPTIAAALTIQKARLEARRQRSTPVTITLGKVENQMRSAGYFELALEARLARAQALAGPARKSELKAVTEEARQHGYLLLARKAAETPGA